MESSITKSPGAQVKTVKYIEDKNILELDYGGDMAKGCVFGSHK